MLQLDLPHGFIATTTADDIDDDQPVEGKETLHVIFVHEGSCICGKWQDNEYPHQHAIAYLHKWKNLLFAEILNKHVHQY